jgi:hypothetical protein
MGFRDYSPGLNRFLTRDMYNGALADLQLGTDPWNTNRYAFAGGNPITGIELDGHINKDESYGGGYIQEDLEKCGPSCHIQSTDKGVQIVGDPPKDPTPNIAKNIGHATLDLLGLIPVGGELADGLNCGWYGAEGDALNAGLSCAGMIPIGGWGATASKWGLRGAKAADDVAEVDKGVAKLAGACGFKSFSGETSVEMGDGSHKPISEVRVGDEVLATDPETGERGPRKVTHLWVHSDTLTDLEVEGGEVITTTEDHPFWNATDHEYQRADQLDRGDQLLAADGRLVRVVGLRPGSQRVTTAYNLTVDDIHTYYVLAGDTPVLVHNCGGLSDPWQAADRVSGAKDGHVWKLHGPGTPAVSKNGTASKFGTNTSPEDVINAAMDGVNKNTYGGAGEIPGTHYHLYDTRVNGFGTVDGVSTSWVKIYVDDAGRLGTIFPVIR